MRDCAVVFVLLELSIDRVVAFDLATTYFIGGWCQGSSYHVSRSYTVLCEVSDSSPRAVEIGVDAPNCDELGFSCRAPVDRFDRCSIAVFKL